MKKLLFLSVIIFFQACNSPDTCAPEHCKDNKNKPTSEISDKKEITAFTIDLSCKLTSPEL